MSTAAVARSRVRVVDARPIARSLRETFTAKDVRAETELPFGWPTTLQHVGDSLAVAYASDKWKQDGDFDLYKHVAESPNRVFCAPGFLCRFDKPGEAWPTIGPRVSFVDVPMPKHFAVLALFEEADLRLFTDGDDDAPEFGGGDEGIVKVVVKHAILGAGKIRWSTTSKGRKDQPFLFVYSEPKGNERGGVHLFIVGEELDVERDGIVG